MTWAEFKQKVHDRELLPFLYLVIGIFALRWTIVEPYVVPTSSMEPTLKPGDRLYALKCAYDVRFPFTDWVLLETGEIRRGDVILFRAPPDPSITFVKRAIGLPGDKIEFRDGTPYVNGSPALKTLAQDRSVMLDTVRQEQRTLFLENLSGVTHYMVLDNILPNNRDLEEITVPPGHLFAVGDNRDNSHDGRAWGFVPIKYLKGKALFIWFSSWDFIPKFERVGTLIR